MTAIVRSFAARAELIHRSRPGEVDPNGRTHRLASEVELWALDVTRPAMVLGSAQTEAEVDRAACRQQGVDVVRRRSGGGVVLVEPGAMVWVDVIVPAGHRDGDDDVVSAMVGIGARWARALGSLGIAGPVVWDGRSSDAPRPVRSRMCFAGLGSGEVMLARAKLVGLSQRRTRLWARYQGMVHVRWNPDRLLTLLAPPVPAPSDLLSVASVPAAIATAVPSALAATFA